MKIAVGADHRGQAVKEQVAVLLGEQGHDVVDMGTNSSRSCDYPDVAYPVSRAVADARVERAILIDGNGLGMSICANKIAGVRAALCHDELTAEMSRRHNNSNILCLASDVLGDELTRRIISSWLTAEFDGSGRHGRRVRKLELIEQGKDPNEFEDDTVD